MADGAEGEVEVAGPAHTDDNIDMEEDSDEAQDQNEQQVGADFDRGESDPDDDGWEDDSEEDETDERGGGAPSTVVSKLSRAAMRRKISAFVEHFQAFTTEDQETAGNALLQAIGGNFAHMTTSFALVSSSTKVDVK